MKLHRKRLPHIRHFSYSRKHELLNSIASSANDSFEHEKELRFPIDIFSSIQKNSSKIENSS